MAASIKRFNSEAVAIQSVVETAWPNGTPKTTQEIELEHFHQVVKCALNLEDAPQE